MRSPSAGLREESGCYDSAAILLIILKNFLYHFVFLRDERRYFTFKASVMRAAARIGLYEAQYLRFLPFFVRPGSDVLDVGANFGAYTQVMSRLVGPSGRVLAFEPLPPSADLLAQSCGALANVELVREALSGSRQPAVELRVPFLPGGVPEPALAAVHPVLSSGMHLKTWKVFQVPVRRLDDHLDSFRDVSFIKVDVEGHEAAFLSGAIETIRRFRPVLQLESSGVRSRAAVVELWTRDAGYVLLIVRGRRLEISSAAALVGLNAYLVPEEALDRIPPELLHRRGRA